MNFRIGYGYDVHRLEEGRKLTLGGIHIPHPKGCAAHSDGDVLIHAICDALLGAAALRDIGFHFPDNDPQYHNIDSKILLKKTIQILAKHGYSLVNIDSTICLQSPKIKQYIPAMISTLARTLSVDENKLSVKATTTEKLGFVGEEKGVAAHATVLIERTS
ncbi:MAG: 2-C-methyl-D-erythritol 2,4-cyclodiphosphate synthase [Bacteroidales bacterium]|jgi:2-C-methyl-D-erythritol 2,4-cyclodiphosphate synthase|nr:2-C-methyl-D-erythritol 2,4-cyclodiphosphate synthase [Bacteroidales bacterium]